MWCVLPDFIRRDNDGKIKVDKEKGVLETMKARVVNKGGFGPGKFSTGGQVRDRGASSRTARRLWKAGVLAFMTVGTFV